MQGGKAIIIGGGTMGTDIASIFISNGLDAEIVEPNAARREKLGQSVLAAAHEIGRGDVSLPPKTGPLLFGHRGIDGWPESVTRTRVF